MTNVLLKTPCAFFNRIHILIVSLFSVYLVQGLVTFFYVEKVIKSSSLPSAFIGNLHNTLIFNFVVGIIAFILGVGVYVVLWKKEYERRKKTNSKLEVKIDKLSITSMIKEPIYNGFVKEKAL